MFNPSNPLNVRHVSGQTWYGETGMKNGFCVFSMRECGIRAACVIIARSYPRRGITSVQDIISTWAPPKENPTDAYISYVCARTGFKPNWEIASVEDVARLVSAMAFFESRASIGADEVKVVMQKYNIQPWRG